MALPIPNIEATPELFKQGLLIYEGFLNGMERAQGLKQYAENLSHIMQIMNEVNNDLTDQERELAKTLGEAYELSQKGMDKAVFMVTMIEQQSSLLALILAETGPGSDKEKLFTACASFATFAKDVDSKLSEARDALRDASTKLFSAQNGINSIVNTLKRVHDNFIDKQKKAVARQRSEVYGAAAVGILAGPIGLLISYGIASGVLEGMTIPEIKKDFERQRGRVSGYVADLKKMRSETKDLLDELDEQRTQLTNISARLSTLASLAGNKDLLMNYPTVLLPAVRTSAKSLVKASKEFLSKYASAS